MWIAQLIVECGLAKSTSDARRLVQGNAVSIGGEKITDVMYTLTSDNVKAKFLLKTGKKNFKQVVVE